MFYGWIITFLAFMSLMTYGLFFSYGIFIEPLEIALNSSRTAVSAVYTIYMIVYSICAIPMGWFSDRHGPRKTILLAAFLIGGGVSLSSLASSVWGLYLSFGVVASIGHGAVFVVPTSTLNRWFVKKRGLAVGLAVSGVGFGLLLVPPLTARIVTGYGWKSGFIVLGLIFFVVNAITGTFIRTRPEDMGLVPYGGGEQEIVTNKRSGSTKSFSWAEAVRSKAFWILYCVCLLCFAAEQMAIVHVVPYCTTIGISITEASLGLSLLGVGTIVGRIVSGAVSDRVGRVATLVICCGIETLAIFSLLIITAPLTLYGTMLLLGLGYGGWVVLCSVLLGEYFGPRNIGTIMGIWFTCGAPAGIMGPLMGGVVFDLTASYFIAILIAGMVCIGAVVLAALAKEPNKMPEA
ncbi:MFS transporter [Thermodesulfobacteriota bacterium]